MNNEITFNIILILFGFVGFFTMTQTIFFSNKPIIKFKSYRSVLIFQIITGLIMVTLLLGIFILYLFIEDIRIGEYFILAGVELSFFNFYSIFTHGGFSRENLEGFLK